MIRRLLSGLVVLVLTGPTAAVAQAPWWTARVARSLARAGDRGPAWAAALQSAPDAHRADLAYLVEHMPTADLRSLPPARLLAEVALARKALAQAPWGARLPAPVVRDAVLPYANVDEPRHPWRAELSARCRPLVRGCTTPTAAAQSLNARLFAELGVKYSTKRRRPNQSPRESIESGLASCTGLSILLVDACRAVGVPARVVGTPSWVDKRGNHTWVEIWDGGWHFLGAAEPDARGLDRAWFAGDAARAIEGSGAHAIYAVSYARTDRHFPLAWSPSVRHVHGVDVTRRYARARDGATVRLLVNVRLRAGGDRVAVPVTVRGPGDAAPRRGTSRDASVDTNDILAFAVPPRRVYEVVVRWRGRALRRRVEVAAKQAVVEVILESPGEPAPR